jgi:hypothetical protein
MGPSFDLYAMLVVDLRVDPDEANGLAVRLAWLGVRARNLDPFR